MNIKQIIPAAPGWYLHRDGVEPEEVMCWALAEPGSQVLPVVRSERAAGFAIDVEEIDAKSCLTGPDESYEYDFFSDAKAAHDVGWTPLSIAEAGDNDSGFDYTVLARRVRKP
jgi:hypothetical protein